MRDKFKGYYRPTKAEEDALWSGALIVMDTNVVLDLYRYHAKTTQLYLESLEKFAERLWLPYQIALEFHKNRPKVRAESTKAHKERIDDLETFANKLQSKAHKTKLASSTAEKKLIDTVSRVLQPLRLEMEQIRKDSMPKTDDPILEKITNLFDGRVGDKPSAATAETLVKDGKQRFDANIPPGYEDRGKKPEGEEYGDYFLWQQILDYAKDTQQDVIFATEDSKADWSWKVNGQIVGPRPELIQEFREKTGHDIIIYSGKEFFEHLSERGAKSVNDEDLADALADVTAVSNERKHIEIVIKQKASEASRDRLRKFMLSSRDMREIPQDGLSDPLWIEKHLQRLEKRRTDQEVLLKKLSKEIEDTINTADVSIDQIDKLESLEGMRLHAESQVARYEDAILELRRDASVRRWKERSTGWEREMGGRDGDMSGWSIENA